MTTASGSFAINFAALSDVNPFTSSSLTYIGAGRGKVLSGVYRWASGAASRTAQIYNGSVSGNLASKIEFATAAGSGDAIAAIICDTTGAGYAAVVNSATSISLIRISALAQADVLGSYAPSLASGDVVELRLNQTTHALTVHINNGSAVASATDSTVTASLAPGYMAIADNTGNATIRSFALDGSVTAAVLSGQTPSGTLGTTTTATIGATTNQNTGTFYAVLATSSGALSGITATQIKAGQVASGSAAPFSGNSAVSTTSPSVNITGLSGNTTYYYAVVQNNSNGDSNVINTGSFTTANPAAALSSGTPSGTIGTQTTANIGATTTQNSGTVYAIVSTVQGDVTGASAANIKAGQKSGGSAAPFSGSATVTTTSPSVAISGLTAGTTYYYAIVQNNGNGDSNIINTGSFTTAAATSTFSITVKSAAGVPLSGVTLRFWTRLTEDGAAIDGGSAGIPIICGSDGVFAISTLTIAKGAGFLYWSNPADPYKRHYIPYTFY